jgi:hypothetical protein
LSDDAFVLDIRVVAGDHEQAEFVALGLQLIVDLSAVQIAEYRTAPSKETMLPKGASWMN